MRHKRSARQLAGVHKFAITVGAHSCTATAVLERLRERERSRVANTNVMRMCALKTNAWRVQEQPSTLGLHAVVVRLQAAGVALVCVARCWALRS